MRHLIRVGLSVTVGEKLLLDDQLTLAVSDSLTHEETVALASRRGRAVFCSVVR